MTVMAPVCEQTIMQRCLLLFLLDYMAWVVRCSSESFHCPSHLLLLVYIVAVHASSMWYWRAYGQPRYKQARLVCDRVCISFGAMSMLYLSFGLGFLKGLVMTATLATMVCLYLIGVAIQQFSPYHATMVHVVFHAVLHLQNLTIMTDLC